MTPLQMLIEQIVSLAWIRCLVEEGVTFIHKQTSEVVKDEKRIYQALQAKTGEFDVPAANASPAGMEKNILEVIGHYLIYTENYHIQQILQTPDFSTLIKNKIDKVRGYTK